MSIQKQKSEGPSDFTILMNWVRDGNLKSEFPKQLENSKALSPVFFLMYFVQNPNYFIYINKVFNKVDVFKLKSVDIYKTFKEIIHFTRYNSYSKKAVKNKENPLIDLLKKKFPYYKREEILMAVNIIDNSDDKDVIYEMFGINNVSKVKKLTQKQIKERNNKIKNMVSSDDVLSIL